MFILVECVACSCFHMLVCVCVCVRLLTSPVWLRDVFVKLPAVITSITPPELSVTFFSTDGGIFQYETFQNGSPALSEPFVLCDSSSGEEIRFVCLGPCYHLWPDVPPCSRSFCTKPPLSGLSAAKHRQEYPVVFFQWSKSGDECKHECDLISTWQSDIVIWWAHAEIMGFWPM